MNPLSQTLVVGLARVGSLPSPDDPAPAALVDGLGLEPERALLLQAGVAAVRARAGAPASPAVAKPEPAPAEARPVCSDGMATLVADLCTSREKELLREALARLDTLGRRLPAHVLPALADQRDPTLLPVAASVCGERGRWLAAFNPSWRWLVDGLAPPSLESRRRIWDEGTGPARIVVLRAVRADDPAEGRRWIEATWKGEKAPVRAEMIDALAIGLGPEDEPLLERALADRAASVRSSAAHLLMRLPESAFAARARARADAILSVQAQTGMLASLKARIVGERAVSLKITLPDAFDPAWAADGIVESPPSKGGQKAFWLEQVLSMVHPDHWCTRFATTPAALIGAADGLDWQYELLRAWAMATIAFGARDWAWPLVHAPLPDSPASGFVGCSKAELFPLLPPAQQDDLIVQKLDSDSLPWDLLAAAPRPWSERLSHVLLDHLTRRVSPRGLSSDDWADATSWKNMMGEMALALPPSLIPRALAIEPAHEASSSAAALVRNAFDPFRATLKIRQRIHQET